MAKIEKAKLWSLAFHFVLFSLCAVGASIYRKNYQDRCDAPIDMFIAAHLLVFSLVLLFDIGIQNLSGRTQQNDQHYEMLLIADQQTRTESGGFVVKWIKEFFLLASLIAAFSNCVLFLGVFIWFLTQCGFSYIGNIGWWYTVLILAASLHCVVMGGTSALMLHHRHQDLHSYTKKARRQATKSKFLNQQHVLESMKLEEGPNVFVKLYQSNDLFWWNVSQQQGLDFVEMQYLLYYCTWPTQTTSKNLTDILTRNNCVVCNTPLIEDTRILMPTMCKHLYHGTCAKKSFPMSENCKECGRGIRRFIFPEMRRQNRITVFPPSYLPEVGARIIRNQKEDIDRF